MFFVQYLNGIYEDYSYSYFRASLFFNLKLLLPFTIFQVL